MANKKELGIAPQIELTPTPVDPMEPTTSMKTPNYGLPQWAGDDLTDWFELNTAFSKIDEAMKANATDVQANEGQTNSNTAAIGNLTTNQGALTVRVTTSENDIVNLTQQVQQNTTHNNEQDDRITANETAIAALNESSSTSGTAIGQLRADTAELQKNMTSAQQAINVNTQNIGNLPSLNTPVKSSLVAAINSLAGGEAGSKDSWAYYRDTAGSQYATDYEVNVASPTGFSIAGNQTYFVVSRADNPAQNTRKISVTGLPQGAKAIMPKKLLVTNVAGVASDLAINIPETTSIIYRGSTATPQVTIGQYEFGEKALLGTSSASITKVRVRLDVDGMLVLGDKNTVFPQTITVGSTNLTKV